jgi:hypothetical protein
MQNSSHNPSKRQHSKKLKEAAELAHSYKAKFQPVNSNLPRRQEHPRLRVDSLQVQGTPNPKSEGKLRQRGNPGVRRQP